MACTNARQLIAAAWIATSRWTISLACGKESCDPLILSALASGINIWQGCLDLAWVLCNFCGEALEKPGEATVASSLPVKEPCLTTNHCERDNSQQEFLIQTAVLSWLPLKACACFSQPANHSFRRAVLVFRYYKGGKREHEGKDISCFRLLLLPCQLWALCDCVQIPRMVVALKPSLKMGRNFTKKKWGCPIWKHQLSLRAECWPGSREVQSCGHSSLITYPTGEEPYNLKLAGSQFPKQGLNPDHGVKAQNPNP